MKRHLVFVTSIIVTVSFVLTGHILSQGRMSKISVVLL